MANIAIIDDDKDQGETLRKTLNGYLRKFGSSLTAVWNYPFHNIEDYFKFVTINDVCVLVLDERLNVKKTPEGMTVNYKGNELVVELRKRLKDFPIFMITTYPNDSDVQDKSGEFEYIFSREEVNEDKMASMHIPRIVRSAQRYLESNKNELAQFNNLTNKIASGDYEEADLQILNSLQAKLEIPFSGFSDRQSWLDEYEKQIIELESLKQSLTQKINK